MIASIITLTLLAAARTQTVIFLFTDGLRRQEVFSGADVHLNANDKTYWRETPEARRAALMPFTWSVIAKQGQIYGNRWKGSKCRVLNPTRISYAGYGETLQGYFDPAAKSNEPAPNPNKTVFEWLAEKPTFKRKVAGFASWNVASAVFNKKRCGFYTQCGAESVRFSDLSAARLYNRVIKEANMRFDPNPDDAFTHAASVLYLRLRTPRVMAVMHLETDSWAHLGHYAKYLSSAHRFDSWLKEYWETLQSMPEYRGKTSIIISTDHGRGVGRDWHTHGPKVAQSEETWIMALGPDVAALGEMKDVPEVTNGQVATTIAAWLGEDYRAAQPKAAPAILAMLAKPGS